MANKKASVDTVRTGIEEITTQGDLLYKGATDLERLPKGSSGQTLKMGSGNEPEWTTVASPASPSWTTKSSGNLSGASELVITGLTKTSRVNLQCVPSSDGPFMILLSSTDGGSSYASSYSIGASANGAMSSASIGQVSAGVGNDTGENLHLVLDIFDPATSHHTIFGSSARHSGTNGQGYQYLATTVCLTAQSTNAIKLYFSSSATMTGSYTVLELN